MKKSLYIFKYTFLMLVIILTISSGCKKKSRGVPEDVLDKEQMVKVMVDMNLFEASLRVNQAKNAEDSAYIKSFYEMIFKKNKTTKKQFNNSLNYYTKHPEKFGEVYDEVVNRLARLQSEEKSKK